MGACIDLYGFSKSYSLAGYTFNILSLFKLLFPSMSLGPKHTSIREAFFIQFFCLTRTNY